MTPSVENRRPENLALHFQEVLTAIERLRGNRQGVSDANAFRHHAREALRIAAGQALAAGYTGDDVKYATYATVAFLDESVLNSRNAVFADWARKPLQEEMFGTQIAGEVFFQHLQQLLGRNDSADLADLLEVYYLCLVLGFGGRYSAGNRGELGQIMSMTAAKIYRVRARFSQLSPSWALPKETVRGRRDPWVRRLAIIAIATAVAMVLLFVVYKIVLGSGVHVTVASGRSPQAVLAAGRAGGENTGDRRLRPRGAGSLGVSAADGARLGTEPSLPVLVPAFSRTFAGTKGGIGEKCGLGQAVNSVQVG